MNIFKKLLRRIMNNDTVEGILASFSKAQTRLEELAAAESERAVKLSCKAAELGEASADAAALSIVARRKAAKIAEFLG